MLLYLAYCVPTPLLAISNLLNSLSSLIALSRFGSLRHPAHFQLPVATLLGQVNSSHHAFEVYKSIIHMNPNVYSPSGAVSLEK